MVETFSLPDLSAVLDGVDDGITVQDRGGHLVYANAVAAKLIGFDSVTSLLSASPEQIVAAFELFDEEG